LYKECCGHIKESVTQASRPVDETAMLRLRGLVKGVAHEREPEDERLAILASLTETQRLTEEIKKRLKECVLQRLSP